MRYQLSVLSPANKSDIVEIISIYQEAIDPSEQKSRAEIEEMISNPDYIVFVSRKDDALSGFLIAFFPEAAGFWLLEYMAIAVSSRGERLGEALFLEAQRYGLERDSSRQMLIEVDQATPSPNPKNDTLSRYRFYRRLNCCRVAGLDYLLPLETGSSANAPPPMMLLVSPPAPETVSKSQVRAWLTAIYKDVYQQSETDPRIENMLAPLPEQIALAPL